MRTAGGAFDKWLVTSLWLIDVEGSSLFGISFCPYTQESVMILVIEGIKYIKICVTLVNLTTG